MTQDAQMCAMQGCKFFADDTEYCRECQVDVDKAYDTMCETRTAYLDRLEAKEARAQ